MAVGQVFKKLYQGQPAAAGTTLFTVPTDHTYVVKHIRVTNGDTAAHTIKFYQDGTTAPYLIQPVVSLAAGEFASDEAGFIFEAGGTLYAVTDADSMVTVTVYGQDRTLA